MNIALRNIDAKKSAGYSWVLVVSRTECNNGAIPSSLSLFLVNDDEPALLTCHNQHL